MSGLLHFRNLRQYVCYLAKISNWEIIAVGDHLIVYNGVKDSLFNYVFCSSAITESEFVTILAKLNERGWNMSWAVEPGMSVLKMYLGKYNIGRTSNPKKAFLDLSRYTIPSSKIDTSVKFKQIFTLEEVQLFDDLSSRIFWHRPGVLVPSFRGIGEADPNRLRFFLASLDGKIVGVCGFYLDERVACFYADGVLQEYRERGIGMQLILQRLALVKELGCDAAIAHCINPISESLYRKMGFKMLGGLGLYYSECA
ncbi:GNAT family N-acetyltransferase [Neorickettsia sennetsu]|uniref:GNAT family N-acetyltransferase n=1 Tax=Ehrlichia sennetsu TaxID=951 RepID=UPI0002F2BEC6|nr:GNAT family N-acetyltransferase [Neorickettsia sennetsu]